MTEWRKWRRKQKPWKYLLSKAEIRKRRCKEVDGYPASTMEELVRMARDDIERLSGVSEHQKGRHETQQ